MNCKAILAARVFSYLCFLWCFGLFAEPSQTICLNMIVKNESQVIERCLGSLKHLIDYWVIVDTGSTDGTQRIIQDFMKDIPGELHERSWVNFEHNRNEALNLAKNKCDYCLFIDADERLIFSPEFVKPKLDKDYYLASVHQADGLNYQRILLINSHMDWKWEGVIHEVLTNSQALSSELLRGVVNYSNTAEGARSQDPKKYHRDAQILEEALLKDPANSRYTFYLAQSYANAKEHLLALKNYQKRASMGGSSQEIFWSLYCIPRLQKILNEPAEIIIENLWRAFQYQPSRAEPLFELIGYYLVNQDYPLAYTLAKYATSIPLPTDMIFVDQRVYDYALLIQLAEAAYFIGKYEEAFQAVTQLLANPRLPQQERNRLERNLSILKEHRIDPKIPPRVSIITSVWNGDLFIENFLIDVTQQTIFNQCELILVNANSPGSEDAIIERYRAQYPNILYIKLPFDPGLYGVWNHAIKIASAPFIANMNLDDRNRVDCLEKQAEALETDPSADLVYAAHYLTKIPNETYKNNHHHGGVNPPEFSMKNMFYCLPGPRPMWRKSLHERYGFFSELFSSAGDYEMWLRAVSMGAKFKKIPGILSLIFENPKGLSTDQDPKRVQQRQIELELIAAKYSYLYGNCQPR